MTIIYTVEQNEVSIYVVVVSEDYIKVVSINSFEVYLVVVKQNEVTNLVLD